MLLAQVSSITPMNGGGLIEVLWRIWKLYKERSACPFTMYEALDLSVAELHAEVPCWMWVASEWLQ